MCRDWLLGWCQWSTCCWARPHIVFLWVVANISGSSINFQDVISVISKFSFIVTPYPLILSFEIHCGTDQQMKMAKILRDILGDELLLHPLKGPEEDLASPEDLKYKILLKITPLVLHTNVRLRTARKIKMKFTMGWWPQSQELITIHRSCQNVPISFMVTHPVYLVRQGLFLHYVRWQYTPKRSNGIPLNMLSVNSLITFSVSPKQRSRNLSRVRLLIIMLRNIIENTWWESTLVLRGLPVITLIPPSFGRKVSKWSP